MKIYCLMPKGECEPNVERNVGLETRWKPKGKALLEFSETPSLAIAKLYQNVGWNSRVVSLISTEVEDVLVSEINPDYANPEDIRLFGECFLDAGKLAISCESPWGNERTVLLNPNHEGYGSLKFVAERDVV